MTRNIKIANGLAVHDIGYATCGGHRAPREEPMLRTLGAAVGALIAILFLVGIATHLPHIQ